MSRRTVAPDIALARLLAVIAGQKTGCAVSSIQAALDGSTFLDPITVSQAAHLMLVASSDINAHIKRVRADLREKNLDPKQCYQQGAASMRVQRALIICFLDLLTQVTHEEYEQLDLFATLLHQLFIHLGSLQMWCYTTYHEVPKKFWQELNQAYHYVSLLELEKHGFFELSKVGKSSVSLTQRYLAIVMLNAANTSRFSLQQIIQLQSLLQSWTAYLNLHNPANAADLLWISGDTDEGPLYQVLVDEQRRIANEGLSIDTLHLIETLEALQANASVGIKWEGEEIAAGFIDALLLSWRSKPVRRYTRQAQQQGTIRLLPENLMQPAEDMAGVREWQIINTSPDGYCLSTHYANGSEIRIGSLVKIQEVGEAVDSVWQLGVVRWLKHDDAEMLVMGVQLIAGKMTRVEVMNQQQHASAILLPRTPRMATETILLRTDMAHSGDELVVASGNEKSLIQLGAELDKGADFSVYHFHTSRLQ